MDRIKYCSRICKINSQKKKTKNIECLQCKSLITIIDGRKRTFCSLKCQSDRRLSIKISKSKICKYCSKQFDFKKGDSPDSKFCSMMCSNNNKKITHPEYIVELYNKKVIKTDDCWSWNGNKDQDGYAIFGCNKKTFKAHRVSWQIYNCEITNGLFVLHKCDNRICTNPEHLFLGTARDNLLDMIKKGRRVAAKGETHSRAKLKNENVLEIRSLLKEGNSFGVLSKKFSVDRGVIRDIKHKKTWKHI